MRQQESYEHFIEKGEKLTQGEKRCYNRNGKRDLAIVTFSVRRQVRVSECVGIDIDDVDFEINGVKIVRKGGNEMVVYFGDKDVEIPFKNYIEERKKIEPKSGSENALFCQCKQKNRCSFCRKFS